MSPAIASAASWLGITLSATGMSLLQSSSVITGLVPSPRIHCSLRPNTGDSRTSTCTPFSVTTCCEQLEHFSADSAAPCSSVSTVASEEYSDRRYVPASLSMVAVSHPEEIGRASCRERGERGVGGGGMRAVI